MEFDLLDNETDVALTLPQRAAVALGSGEHEAKLRELVAASADIVEVKNTDGREQAHRVGMNLKNARIAISKTGKAAREDAQAFCKAVIAEEARLIGIIEPEEERVFKLRDDFDAAEESKRQAAIKAERERVEGIQTAINSIRNEVLACTGKPTSWIKPRYDKLCIERPAEDFYQEFHQEAIKVWGETLRSISDIIDSTAARELAEAQEKAQREAEVARIKAEREELDRQRAEAQREAAALAAARAEIERQQAELSKAKAEAEAAAAEALRQKQAETDAIAERVQTVLTAAQDSCVAESSPAQTPASAPADLFAVTYGRQESTALVNLGTINEALGYVVSSDLLAKLGFVAIAHKSAKLYRESDYQAIKEALAQHTLRTVLPFKEAA